MEVFLNRNLRFYPTKRFPVVLLPGGETMMLTDEIIDLLQFLKDGATLEKAYAKLNQLSPGINGELVMKRLIDQGVLFTQRMKYRWNSNTFGTFLVDENECEALTNLLKAKRICRHNHSDIDGIAACRKSPCIEFESRIASLVNANYCRVLNSGTSALDLALQLIEITPGDEIILPAYTYIGTVATIINAGAVPVICNIDKSYMLSPDAVRESITPRTKAIICVHMQGVMTDMEKLSEVAREHGVYLIEDCAQALGVTLHGRPIGSFGDIGCFSFHQHKIISCGEGGAITTNRKEWFDKICLLSDASRVFAHQNLLPGLPGHNYRMSELHAAIGLVQLDRLEMIATHLRQLHQNLTEKILQIPGLKIWHRYDPEGIIPQSIYITHFSPEKALALTKYLQKLGVPAKVLYKAGEVNHDVYVFWPYALIKMGIVEEWNPLNERITNLCVDSLELLGKTVCIPLGVGIAPELATQLGEDIRAFSVADNE